MSSSEQSIDRYTLVPTKSTLFGKLRCAVAHTMTQAYVVSFPKSGRTWLRMLLATYFSNRYGVAVTPEITEQWRQNFRVPRIRFGHLGAGYIGNWEQRFDFSLYSNKRVVYLTRDPRDVVVSYYFHVTRRWQSYPPGLDDISVFVRDPDVGLPRLVGYMNLMERELGELGTVCRTSYESLHADAAAEMVRVLRFIGIPDVSESSVASAVAQCSFDRMQSMERKGAIDHEAMKPADADDLRTYKVREGKVGGYRKHLGEGDIQYVEDYLRDNLASSYKEYRSG